MERRSVYPVRAAPDAALAHLEQALERAGFSVGTGSDHDLDARRGTDRVLVGIAPHTDGLVAVVKGKALIPGRSEEIVEQVETMLAEHLGPSQRQQGGRPGG